MIVSRHIAQVLAFACMRRRGVRMIPGFDRIEMRRLPARTWHLPIPRRATGTIGTCLAGLAIFRQVPQHVEAGSGSGPCTRGGAFGK